MEIKLTNVAFLLRKQLLMNIMRIVVFFFCTTFFAFTPNNVVSQNSKIKIAEDKLLSVHEVFYLIMEQTDYKFFYEDGIFENFPKVQVKKGVIKTKVLLEKSLSKEDFIITLTKNNSIVIKESSSIKDDKKPQQTYNGSVKDSNGQPLPGASIAIEGTTKGTTADIDGNFTIEIVDSNSVLVVSFIGYKTIKVPLSNQSTTLNITLEEDSSALDEVIITGIRASQQRAVNIKKNSVGFVDAITAESAGKLPDTNVAEALQRVAGVSISRTRGQGDFISIRGLGPEFARGSLNGRSIVSASTSRNTALSGGLNSGTGRATNFDVLPSDIIETIEVFKTSSAEHVEGGIGGTVNIKTVQPLDIGNKFGFNTKGTSFMGRNLSPSISAYGSFANEANTLGAFLTVSYSNRLIREDAARSFAYRLASASGELAGTEFENNLFPFSSLPEVIEEDRERTTVSGTIQWKPSEKTNIVFDGTYSKRNLDYIGRQANIRINPLNGTNTVLESIVLNENNNLVSYTGNAPIFLNTDAQESQDDLFSVGLNIEQELGKWTSILDVSLGTTATDFSFKRGALRVPGSSPDFLIPYNTSISDGIVQVESTSSFDFSDANNFVSRGFSLNENNITDSEFATRIDFERDIDGFFSKFKGGLRYRGRNRENSVSSFLGNLPVDGSGNAIALNLATSGAGFVNGQSGFLDGKYSNGLFEQFLFIEDVDEWIGAHEAQGGVFELVEDPNNTFNVIENTFAVYSQLDIDGKIGDFPITGNIGVRLVNTSVTVEGERQDLALTPADPNDPDPNAAQIVSLTGDLVSFSNKGSYFNFLPSVNLRIEAAPNVFFRTAYSKTITRPQFVNLGGFSFNSTNRVANSVGNPDLNPFQSNNYDVGLEWYTGGAGAIGISFFYKNLSSFVTGVNFSDFEALGVVWDSYNTSANQGEGFISGTEITFQQPLKFLPGFLDGLGIIANFTFADGEQSLNDGTPIAFPGVSDFSFNSALYYDKGGKFNARLAYTFRDEFLILPSDVFGQEQYNDSYGQFDASVSYKILDNITLYGEAINLTNEHNILFSSNATSPAFNLERPTSYELTGTRLSFGIRGTF